MQSHIGELTREKRKKSRTVSYGTLEGAESDTGGGKESLQKKENIRTGQEI